MKKQSNIAIYKVSISFISMDIHILVKKNAQNSITASKLGRLVCHILIVGKYCRSNNASA